MAVTDQIDAMVRRLREADEKLWNPEHDLPVFNENTGAITGACSSHAAHELRMEIEALALFIRELDGEIRAHRSAYFAHAGGPA